MDNQLWILLVAGTLFTWYRLDKNRDKLRMNNIMPVILAILHTLVGVLCVKIFAFLETGKMDGQSLFGAVFFMPVIYFLAAKISKRKVADVFDIFVICMIFTLLCARVNCILAGCCKGLLLPGSEDLRWPTRELEILFYIAILFWLDRKAGNEVYSGEIYLLYMIAYGVFRFIIEWFRETEIKVGVLHISHIWAIVSILAGTAMLIGLKERKDREKGGEERDEYSKKHK